MASGKVTLFGNILMTIFTGFIIAFCQLKLLNFERISKMISDIAVLQNRAF
jgi:hypothetical protein